MAQLCTATWQQLAEAQIFLTVSKSWGSNFHRFLAFQEKISLSKKNAFWMILKSPGTILRYSENKMQDLSEKRIKFEIKIWPRFCNFWGVWKQFSPLELAQNSHSERLNNSKCDVGDFHLISCWRVTFLFLILPKRGSWFFCVQKSEAHVL